MRDHDLSMILKGKQNYEISKLHSQSAKQIPSQLN